MKADIVAKLNRELDEEIVTERQVVYILVEARKLLEQRQTLDTFRAFKLCGDWAVHPKLRGPDSQLVLRYFDAYEVEFQNSGATMAEFQLEPLHDFVSHRRFRAEFIQALAPYGVNVDRLASETFWRAFIQHYSSVIQDVRWRRLTTTRSWSATSPVQRGRGRWRMPYTRENGSSSGTGPLRTESNESTCAP